MAVIGLVTIAAQNAGRCKGFPHANAQCVRFCISNACLQGKWENTVSADFSEYEECSWHSMRLPATVAPVLYDLRLQVSWTVRV